MEVPGELKKIMNEVGETMGESGLNLLSLTIHQKYKIMKRSIKNQMMVVAVKYVLVFLFIMLGVMSILFSPELYRLSDLNFGPCIAILCVGIATLIWDSVDD